MSSSRKYPLATIGLIGGGQLGRMTIKAAKRLGATCTILDPDDHCPACQLASKQLVAGYHDADAIRQLSNEVDVITFELENIDADTLASLEAEGKAIYPSSAVLKTIQDKLVQKQFLAANDIPTSEFIEANEPSAELFEQFGYPLVQKARRGGYDGRGVAIMKTADNFDKHLPIPSLIERFVKADKEIAILVARSTKGEVKTYPPVEMVFNDENMLDILLAPALIPETVAQEAQRIAEKTVKALNGVGIFGVEMFVTEDGQVLVNEIAPRTHNSGHHTIEANVTDQFEQHLRAILGLPLGSTETLCPAAMVNLLGAPGETGKPELRGLDETLSISGVNLHLYGKNKTSPYRKMGHITILDKDIKQAAEKAALVKTLITIGAEKNDE